MPKRAKKATIKSKVNGTKRIVSLLRDIGNAGAYTVSHASLIAAFYQREIDTVIKSGHIVVLLPGQYKINMKRFKR